MRDKEDDSQKSSSSPTVMRRFALLVDGMARAIVLPFGPTLVHRLVYNSVDRKVSTWSEVGYFLGWVVAIYIFGRWLGSSLATKWKMSRKQLPINIARLGGIALSLHVFTYGAGLASVRWLVAIRLFSAILAGLLCGITNSISLPEDDWVYRHSEAPSIEEERVDALRRREGYVDIASGTAKIYLTGFAVSILHGGLLFRKATKDHTFQALTGAYQYSWSPLFLVGVAVAAEIVLRGLFALARNPNVKEDPGKAGFVRGVVRRMVSDVSEKTGRDVVVAMEHLTAVPRVMSPPTFRPLLEEDLDDMSDVSGLGRHSFYDADTNQQSRSRMSSYASADEFFDCRSMFSNETDGGQGTITSHSVTVEQHAVARYCNGACRYDDDTPAYVPAGDCAAIIPQNYLEFYNYNETRARRAWEDSQRYRLEHRVWKIHSIPNTWFHRIKDAYPHVVHGHSKAGYPVVYENPGRMNLKELFRSGCEIDDMIKHLTFFLEYLSNRVCQHEDIKRLTAQAPEQSSAWGMMVVMDVKGAGLSHLSGDVVKYLTRAGEVNSKHYPLCMKRAFVVNSPFWLAGAWTGLKGILPDSVQVDILSESKYPAALREYIDADQIPPEYGGTSPYKLGEHPYEISLGQLADDVMDNSSTTQDDIDIENQIHEVVEEAITPTRPTSWGDDSFLELSPGLKPPTVIRTLSPIRPIRRRIGSVDRSQKPAFRSVSKTASINGQRDVFWIVSAMHVLWSFVQGAIEAAIPLWILSPTMMGGLGYSPSRSGVCMFCSCLVLLWTLRTQSSKLVSKIPSKSPLRAYRIGAGSESALLALLACVSTSTSPWKRNDSIVVMASTVILFASMALATMIGRSASKILHRIAAESFGRLPRSQRGNTSSLVEAVASHCLAECESGGFTAFLNLVAEMAGIFLVAPIWSFSIYSERNAPFNATCILFASSLITFALYVSSFALHLNSAGEFAPHPKDNCGDSRWKRCFQFVCEVVAVSAGDMASLFSEANWTATPLLGLDRSRTFSETSMVSFAEMMERGEDLSTGRKAR